MHIQNIKFQLQDECQNNTFLKTFRMKQRLVDKITKALCIKEKHKQLYITK